MTMKSAYAGSHRAGKNQFDAAQLNRRSRRDRVESRSHIQRSPGRTQEPGLRTTNHAICQIPADAATLTLNRVREA
jgi:hypothetical protein